MVEGAIPGSSAELWGIHHFHLPEERAAKPGVWELEIRGIWSGNGGGGRLSGQAGVVLLQLMLEEGTRGCLPGHGAALDMKVSLIPWESI